MSSLTLRVAAGPVPRTSSLVWRVLFGLAVVVTVSSAAHAQTPTAVDDAFTAASGSLLEVEAPGVLDNDHDGDEEPPPSPTAVANLSTDVSHGILFLNGDGSFTYDSDPGFFGVDTFTYYFTDGPATSNTATVTITVSGCEPGLAPTQWVCWVEQAYLVKAAELGLSTFVEGFEDDVTWGAARAPATAANVTSQTVTWASNFSFNDITTGDGPARSGTWGVYSLPHGDQSGAPTDRIRDGFTGTASAPDGLSGVGGWLLASQIGSRVDLIVTHDGGAMTTAAFPNHTLSWNHIFFGFIDTAGFTSFEIVETDGTVDQPFFVFGDDFSLLVPGADTTPPRVVGIGSWEDTGDGVLSEGESTDVAITELMVEFSEPVQDLPGDTDPDDVTNPANYLLFDDGGDGFDTFNCAGGVVAGDNPIAVNILDYGSGNPPETLLEVNGGFSLPAGSYRLLVCGSTSIVDWAGNPLDGDGNGTGGDDFVRNFNITVTVNHPPVADPQSVSTPEDTALAIILTGSDLDGDPITFFLATGPSNGVLSGVPPNVTYTPFADANGLDSFTFEVEDEFLISDPATVTIDVLPVNDAPTANDLAVTTPEDVALSITLTGSDIDGDVLTFAIDTGPAHGVLTGTSPNLTYTPDTDYNGPDSFTFTANDAVLTSPVATVSITVTTVNNIPLAVDDSDTTDEDTAISIAVLTNDDLGDEPTTITSVTQGTSGAVAIDPGATTVTYTPNLDTNGADSFSYTMTDADLETSTATVSMTVTAINDAPIADAGADQTAFVTDTVTLDGSGSSDVDGDPLTYAWAFTSVPLGSTASLSDPTAVMPTFVIDLPGNFVVELIVWDGTLFSTADTVTVSTDNSPPVADAGPDQSAFVTDTVTLDGSGSSDVDGDALTYAWSFSSVPLGSTASLSDPTAIMPTFVIDLPGAYDVELVVWDGTVFSAPDTVTISTDNSAPVADAGPDQTALVNDTVTLDGSGSSDVDGDPLTYAWSFSSVPLGSTASLSDPTAVMPTFVVDLPGAYVVQLIVWDGTVFSAPDTVTISTDNSPPVADPQSVSTLEDTGLGITLTGSDPDGDPITFAIGTGPTHGVLTGTPPNVTYTPGANYHGPDSFSFTASDGTLTSPAATVSITVTPVNDRPTADDQSVSTPEDTALGITLTGGDVDGDALTFAIGTGPTHGVLTGTPPSVSYTPEADYHGPDSFSFTASDATLTSPAATVSITVTPVNDTPLAVDDSDTTDEDTAIGIAVLSNDAIGDPPTTITAVTQGTSGTVVIDPGATSVTYTPDPDTNGADSFTYTITDADLETSTATVSMTVTAVADPVLTIGDASSVEPDTGTSSVTVTINVSEPNPVSIAVDFATADGTAVGGLDYVAASGTVTLPALATSHDVVFEVIGDLMDEPEETFFVTLSNPVGATLGTPSSGTVTIFDDDPMPELSADDVVVGEAAGTADVSLTLSESSGFVVTVDFATADGTATAPGDYGAVSGVATIPLGSISTIVTVPIVNDGEIESDEFFSLELSNPNNAVLLTPSLMVTIIDDDGCSTPGDADGNCVLDAADISLIISLIDDPTVPVLGDPDCDGSGIVDGWDLVCVADSMVAQ